MKMNNFASAVPDLNQVLRADPENIKALFRRATCRKHLKMYREVSGTLKANVHRDSLNYFDFFEFVSF